jgi:hypothetical protein
MIRIALLSALALAGCATSTPIRTPSGDTAHLVQCHHDLLACYKTADRLCPVGYEVVDARDGRNGFGYSERYVVVRCG